MAEGESVTPQRSALWMAHWDSQRRRRGRPVNLDKVDTAVAAYKTGKTMKAIGLEMGITRERVRQLLVKYETLTGEIIPRWGEMTCDRIAAIKDELSKGTGANKTARIFHTKAKAVQQIRREMIANGWHDPNDGITDKMIAVVSAYRSGKTQATIGREMGISQSMVSKYIIKYEQLTGETVERYLSWRIERRLDLVD